MHASQRVAFGLPALTLGVQPADFPLARTGVLEVSAVEAAQKLPPDYTRSAAIVGALKSKSRPALAKACGASEASTLAFRCMIATAAIGDKDGAYAIADKLYPRRIGRTPAQTEQIWLNDPYTTPLNVITSPAAAPMRHDVRYLALAERVGLLAYWRSGRPPNFCRKNPEPICAQILIRPQ